jgi:integrase/recombinase XerD
LPLPQDIALVKAHSPAMWGFLIDAAMVSGAREDELLKLCVDELDIKRARVTFLGSQVGGGAKRNRTRTINIDILGAIEVFSNVPRYLGSPYVFWHGAGEPYTQFASHWHRKVHRELSRWAKENGVDFRPFTFHSLRDWHAVEFLRSRSGTLHQLQFRLGHSTIKTTERYVKSGFLTKDEVHRALYGDLLDRASARGGH